MWLDEHGRPYAGRSDTQKTTLAEKVAAAKWKKK